MAKRIFSMVLALAMTLVMGITAGAVEPSDTVEYDGASISYVNGGVMTGFDNMLPGVPYEGAIQLKNTGSKEANFYMDTEIVSTLLGVDNVKDTSYRVSLTVGDNVLVGYDAETDTVTGEIVGGEGTTGLEELNKTLPEYPLVATLKPGETVDVVLSIQPDAEQTDNAYISSLGRVEFRFRVSDVPGQGGQGGDDVQTGDDYIVFICGAVIVVGLILFFVLGRRKKEQKA